MSRRHHAIWNAHVYEPKRESPGVGDRYLLKYYFNALFCIEDLKLGVSLGVYL